MKALLFLMLLAGCALTEEERRTVVEESARLAGEEAARLAHDRARRDGLSDEDARKVADFARVEAGRAAAKIVEKALPKAEEQKRGKLGGAIASALMFLLQFAAAAARKGGRA